MLAVLIWQQRRAIAEAQHTVVDHHHRSHVWSELVLALNAERVSSVVTSATVAFARRGACARAMELWLSRYLGIERRVGPQPTTTELYTPAAGAAVADAAAAMVESDDAAAADDDAAVSVVRGAIGLIVSVEGGAGSVGRRACW